jgi:hypothetical protein
MYKFWMFAALVSMALLPITVVQATENQLGKKPASVTDDKDQTANRGWRGGSNWGGRGGFYGGYHRPYSYGYGGYRGYYQPYYYNYPSGYYNYNAYGYSYPYSSYYYNYTPGISLYYGW